MPLGTLDRTPPPFFRQGPSALTKLGFFSAVAVFLMVADARFRVVEPLRAGLAIVLLPVQRTLAMPVDAWRGGSAYLQGLSSALQGEAQARARLAQQAEGMARAEQLASENQHLRALLGLKAALAVRSQAAEVMYEAADPYSRKVFIDHGRVQGIALGSPVVNEHGVLGQVTRVYPFAAEVTLLVDKDAAVPVLDVRTGHRSVVFGGSAGMELRFTSADADVQPGDLLQTSGLDGIYPPGLPVAKVLRVERRAETGFARIALAPAALPDGVRHVLVLEPVSVQLPPRPDAAASAPANAGRGSESAPANAGRASGTRVGGKRP